MRLERDNIPLDKDFPFQISEVVLTPKNSRPGTWHWHSYFEITCVLELSLIHISEPTRPEPSRMPSSA